MQKYVVFKIFNFPQK